MATLEEAKTLKDLFECWKEEQSNDSGDETCNSQNGCVVAVNSFYEDGIVKPKEYQKSKPKVLFITNEVRIDCKQDNDEKKHGLKGKCEGGHLIGNDKGNTVCSFNNYIDGKEQETWSGKMRIKFGEMYRIITEGENYKIESPFDEKANKEALKKIAFMNLNKRGGFGGIQEVTFLNYLKTYKDYIRREIEIINPDVIVWCGCNTYDQEEYMDAVFDKEVRVGDEKKMIKILKLTIDENRKEIPILRMWHPSMKGEGISIKGYLNHFIKVWDEEKVEVEKYVRDSK